MGRIMRYIMSIKLTSAEMDSVENTLSEFLSSNNIELTAPVDVFALATSLGFDVRAADFSNVKGGKTLEGLILVDEDAGVVDGFRSNKVIVYSATQGTSIDDIKFVVAHELAHYIEAKINNNGNNVVIAARDHDDRYSKNKDEQLKDYMAAAILMPREAIKKKYSLNDYKKNPALYVLLALEYNVNVGMAKRRLDEVFNG